MIAESTYEDVLKAMEQFDQNERLSAEWLNWESKQNHKYAIYYSDKLYPVKHIISLATGTHVNSFSGGDEANNYLKAKGFEIVDLHQDEFSDDQPITEEKSVRSWSKPDGIPNLIGRKKVDLSIFKYGSHVPLQFIEDFERAKSDYHLGRGESKDVVLQLNGYPYKAKLVNVDRKGFNKDTVQIRWDGNNELIELLKNRFDKTYQQISAKISSNHETAEVINNEIINQDVYIDFIKTDIPFQYIMKTIIDGEEILPNVWWVNQGKNISQERSGGYIWAPIKAKNGGQLGHWNRLNDIKTGDVILHYSKGALRYVGRALSKAAEALSPDQSIGDYSDKNGRLVKVEYHQLKPDIALEKISSAISKLIISEGPLDITGAVKQGYLYNFNIDGLFTLKNMQPETQWPDFCDLSMGGGGGKIEPFNMDEKVAELIQTILSQGYTFEPWQIATYICALKTKPFVILAGVSGTGKSKLPSLIAKATGAERLLIPVRPDWTDSSDVLGYCNLQGSFRPGSLLSFAKDAEVTKGKQFVCIMDEMNLARVEHYFAEVLSQIEDRHICDSGGFASYSLINQKLLDEDQHWAKQGIPANLAIVGTVNMDESAHGFSRKVLDRAFTIEFSEINLDSWEKQSNDVSELNTDSWPIEAWYPRAIRLGELTEVTDLDRQEINQVVKALTDINEILIKAQLQVGFRIRDELALFVLHARDMISSFVDHKGNKVDPLDMAIQMKVLPRIIGGSSAIRQVVIELLAWSTGQKVVTDPDAQSLLESWINEGRPSALQNTKFPRTAARLCLMWDRLMNEGFTSFWM